MDFKPDRIIMRDTTSKINNFRVKEAINKDISRLKVSMHDSMKTKKAKPFGYVICYFDLSP